MVATARKAASQPSRFTKINAKGKALPAAAADWDAVLDNRSGLTWAVKATSAASHAKAAAAVKKLKIAGHKDWRLPTVEELFCLADRTRTNPAIDIDHFPGCPSAWFWTSTPYAGAPADFAWFVAFYLGYAYCNDRYHNGFVRAVRGGQ